MPLVVDETTAYTDTLRRAHTALSVRCLNLAFAMLASGSHLLSLISAGYYLTKNPANFVEFTPLGEVPQNMHRCLHLAFCLINVVT